MIQLLQVTQQLSSNARVKSSVVVFFSGITDNTNIILVSGVECADLVFAYVQK